MLTFKETGIIPELLKAIEGLGFEHPTPIQEKTIPHLLSSDKDLTALAQTGTGKTAAFGLPIIQETDINSKATQTLILCPTRELCMQITDDMKNFSKYLGKINIVPVYGGTSIETQIQGLKKGSQIVVGTPGRTLDLIRRKKLKISNIKRLVLDEADEMLTMGFKEELNAIMAETPSEKQTLLFSATMPKDVALIAEQYMNQPQKITSGKRNTPAENITHIYYMVHAKDRYKALKRIVDVNPKIYCIVFCRTRKETKEVADNLMQDGYNADALHGDLSQAQRDNVMDRFRIKHLQVLVATDVAARGLDVSNLSHIINYNLPDDSDSYIHRSGRTGRAGKSGISISIIHTKELHKIREIEKKAGKQFERKRVPGGKEICEKQLFNLVDKVEKVGVDEEQIHPFMPTIYKKLEWLDREELIRQFVSVEFNRFLSYYKYAVDLNIPDKSSEKDNKRGDTQTRFSRFYINIGSKNMLSAVRLIGLINEKLRSKTAEIGKISIMTKFSFFEIDSKYEENILKAFKNVHFEDIPVIVELTKKKPNTPQKPFRKRKRKKQFTQTKN